MVANQDQIILEVVVLGDMVDQEEDVTLETIEVEEDEDIMIEAATETIMVAAVDGNCKT